MLLLWGLLEVGQRQLVYGGRGRNGIAGSGVKDVDGLTFDCC